MAIEIIATKGNTEDLEVHWTEQYIDRHLQLKSKFISALDKKCAEAQDQDIFHYWFELYKTTVEKYSIQLHNRYNMDEKDIMMELIRKVRVIVSKYDKKIYMTQLGNREWISLIECISLDGYWIRP